MNVLWAVPPLVLVLGAVAVSLLLRSADRTAVALRAEVRALADVRQAASTVRAETARARASLEELQRR